ncbi:MAG TPA: DUF6352 family protein [Hyphomicrobiaceae bacterium]|nr:DUF6352 family protein [Hyphomicrobiaceae bacterium]
MSDFWVSSGHHLLDRDEEGYLVLTDEFLKAYLARPEIIPPPEACDAERRLYRRLSKTPRDRVGDGDIAAIKDSDAQENWRALIGFRDHLLAHPTLESAYLSLMRKGTGHTPPLFINQLVHVIMRNVLDGVDDPFALRAGELFYRPQRLTQHEGRIFLADEELVDGAESGMHASPLIAMLGEAAARNLDVLVEENAPGYFARSDAFDMVLDFRHGGPGRTAFAGVMERWLRHMLKLGSRITPLERIEDDNWTWFIGLDAEATRIGNALWEGQGPTVPGLDRVVALFRLDLEAMAQVPAPIYLILAMTPQRIVRMKPQNLLVGLPDHVMAPAAGAS